MKTRIDLKAGLVIGLLGLQVCSFYCGRTFAEEMENVQSKANLYSVSFVNENEGWTCGLRGSVFHTSDGGLNWEKQVIDTRESLLAVSFFDVKTGWIVGKGGLIFHTTDGGRTWKTQKSPKKIGKKARNKSHPIGASSRVTAA